MGSGKTTIAKMLAQSLNLTMLDLDELISVAEFSKLPQIFAKKGEIYFRREEHRILSETLMKQSDLVLATGGGTPCYFNNMELINNNSISFFLQLSPGQIAHRINEEKNQRPLISHVRDEELPEFIAKHLFERNKYYRLAQYTIHVGEKSVENITCEIVDIILQNHQNQT